MGLASSCSRRSQPAPASASRGPLQPTASLLATEGRPIKASDASFQGWCKAALEATSSTTAAIDEQDRLTVPRAFKGIWDYQFTGALRPALVTPQMRMPDSIAKPDYALEPRGVCHSERTLEAQTVIPALAGEDLDAMRAAGRLGREVLDIAAGFLRAGVTGDEIDRVVSQACVDRCIYPSPLNYYGFPKSLCVSPNEVIAHGIPNCRPFEDGDIVNLDVTIYHRGFHADLNETYFIGKVCDDGRRTVQAAYNSLRSATKLIRPGALYRDLGNAIQTEAERHNCAVVREYSGHGIGKLFHGCPRIPHYRRNKAIGTMKVGHVFCVEPMVNDGTEGSCAHWPDNWTAVTANGKLSAAFEHTFLVTDTGFEVLTSRSGVSRKQMPEFDPAMFQR